MLSYVLLLRVVFHWSELLTAPVLRDTPVVPLVGVLVRVLISELPPVLAFTSVPLELRAFTSVPLELLAFTSDPRVLMASLFLAEDLLSRLDSLVLSRSLRLFTLALSELRLLNERSGFERW